MLTDLATEFRRHQRLAETAISSLSDDAFFRKPTEIVNSVALIVKHLAGNYRSRWSDFLTSDGDKPDRDRDGEFEIRPGDTRESLLDAMNEGWSIFWNTFHLLTETDLDKTVTIRGERHTVRQALLRGLTHTAYHTGQILYIARLLAPESPWLTIAPGASSGHTANYLKSPVA